MTTDEMYLLLAETRCEHGHLLLEDAERAGVADDWTAYLRDPAHPCPYEVRDFLAYQTLAPHLPADWMVLRTRAERYGHDYGTAQGVMTLPELARILADAADPADAAGPAWLLHAIHRTGPAWLLHAIHRTGPTPHRRGWTPRLPHRTGRSRHRRGPHRPFPRRLPAVPPRRRGHTRRLAAHRRVAY